MNKLTTGITALALSAAFSFAAIAPASADQAAATRNEIIGGIALVAGIATAINVSNKNAEANAEFGNQTYYTPAGRQNYSNDDNGYRNRENQNDNRDNERRWTEDHR
jgi:hypothetical protein